MAKVEQRQTVEKGSSGTTAIHVEDGRPLDAQLADEPMVTSDGLEAADQLIAAQLAGRTHESNQSQHLDQVQPPADNAEEIADDEGAGHGIVSGRPGLVSAESLPDFKRILTVADDDAALRIPASARKEFVAVELQPGIAITVATARFAEKAQYATFIKDLGTNDILVREEMIAAESVIAAIYSGKTRLPLASRPYARRAARSATFAISSRPRMPTVRAIFTLSRESFTTTSKCGFA